MIGVTEILQGANTLCRILKCNAKYPHLFREPSYHTPMISFVYVYYPSAQIEAIRIYLIVL